MQDIKLGFDPLEGIYVEEREGVRTSRKFVNLEDLRSIFLQEVQVQTPILPTGCRYYAEANGNTYVILESPNLRRTVMYHERGAGEMQEREIPTPFTIFGFVLNGGTIRKSMCLTSQTPIMGDDTMLYRFPLGNVFNDLKICWGNTRLPSIRNAVQLSGLPNLFYSAPFNGDLMGSDSFVGYGHNNMYLTQFFDLLTTCTHFPMDRLKQWNTFARFKEELLASN